MLRELMGYLEGFAVTIRQHRLFGGERVTTEYSGGRRAKRKGNDARDVQHDEKLPRPSGCTAATCSTATRTAWRSASAASCAPVSARPTASTSAAPTTIPRTRRRRASASASSTRSTTCAASTATCASRRARPRRSPRSKLFEFSFTNRQDAIYTKAELVVDDDGKPQQLPWEDWREGDDVLTSRLDAGDVAVGRRRLRGPGRLERRARLRRARSRSPTDRARPSDDPKGTRVVPR